MSERVSEATALRVRVRRVVGVERRRMESTVRCPRRNGSVPAGECMACCDCDGVGARGKETHILCSHPAATERWQQRAAAPMRADVADRVCLADVMTADVVCVSADVPLARVIELFLEGDLAAIVVVDDDDRPIGLVSRGAMVSRAALTRRPGRTTAHVMVPIPFMLGEEATLTDAAMLVAYQAIEHIPIVSRDGRIVGMLASSDVCELVNQGDRRSRTTR